MCEDVAADRKLTLSRFHRRQQPGASASGYLPGLSVLNACYRAIKLSLLMPAMDTIAKTMKGYCSGLNWPTGQPTVGSTRSQPS